MSRKPNLYEKAFRFLEILFEKMKGLDFSKVIPSSKLGFDDSLVVKCSPSGGKYLINTFNSINVSKIDSILDIGCGKGSAIKSMTKFPFKEIVGLEISSQIAKVARKNFKLLKAKKVKIVNINAINYLHYKDFNIFYIYNPFPESIMRIVLKKIISQQKKKKIIKVIYNNPVCSKVFEDYKFILRKKFQDQWGNGINFYEKKI
jgi:16S rRNA G966 N2-methylase RsmD